MTALVNLHFQMMTQFVVTNAGVILNAKDTEALNSSSVYDFLCWLALRYCRLKYSQDKGAPTIGWWTKSLDAYGKDTSWTHMLALDIIDFSSLDSIGVSKLKESNAIGQTIESMLSYELRYDNGSVRMTETGQRRKALGAFFTPKRLIDCVIKETIDPILEDIVQHVGPENRRAALLNIRICDPACGAGYFLISAAMRLASQLSAWEGSAVLKTECLLDVVRNCLYGVDIEPLSLEAARLNLEAQCQKAIPELDVHLRCGNALLDPSNPMLDKGIRRGQIKRIAGRDAVDAFKTIRRTFPKVSSVVPAQSPSARLLAAEVALSSLLLIKDNQTVSSFPTDEVWKKVRMGRGLPKPIATLVKNCARRYQFFSWRDTFKAVFLNGGFDAVIGNPPFLDSTHIKKNQPELRPLMGNLYNTAKGNWDLYIPFTELGLSLLKPKGRMGFVTPNKILASDYAAELQAFMLSTHRLLSMHDYSGVTSFSDAQVPVVISIIMATSSCPKDLVRCVRHGVHTESFCSIETLRSFPKGYIALPLSGDHGRLLQLLKNSIPLSTVAKVSDGASTSEAYIIRDSVQEGLAEHWGEPTQLKLINTGTIDPWTLLWGEKQIRYLGFKGFYPVVDATWFQERFPRRYAQTVRETLVIAGMGARLEAAVAPSGVLCGKSTVLVLPHENVCPYALSAVINLKLWTETYTAFFGLRGLGTHSMNIGPRQIEQLPMVKKDLLMPFKGLLTQDKVTLNQRLSHWGHLLHTQNSDAQKDKIIDLIGRHIEQHAL
ncbi:MAG: Eco57I restriction-modification methylase domain-containing protein [Myxococcota bacterium]